MSEIFEYFTFDGVSSREWNIGLSGTGVWNAPARDITRVAIPGRNGEVIVDNGRWQNVEITFPCWIADGFDARIDDFRAFLAAHSYDYFRLESTYHPDEYRMATFAGAFVTDPGTRNKSGRFDVTFNAMPERWLKSGEEWVTATISNQVILVENEQRFPAYPIIRIQGPAARFPLDLQFESVDEPDPSPGIVSSASFTVLELTESYIDVDLKNFTASCGDVDLSEYVEFTLSADDELAFYPGWEKIAVGFGSSISGVTIKYLPRWYTL